MSCSGHTANKWQTGQLSVALCDGKACPVWHGTVSLFSDARLLLLTAEEAWWSKKCTGLLWRWGWLILKTYRASLVAQWLRICLPMQGTRVRALVWEDPTCRRAAGPVSHNYWAWASGARALQQERLRQWEARAPRWRVAPARHN